MINLISLEGYLFDDPEEFHYKSGKIAYTGYVICYRNADSRYFDKINFQMPKAVFEQLVRYKHDNYGLKGLRIILTGALHSQKELNSYIFVNTVGVVPNPKPRSSSSKERGNIVEGNENV